MNRRKIVYGVIYIGIIFTFPSLPLSGISFLGGLFSGSYEGFKEAAKEDGKDILKDTITEVKGPLWKILNPFE